jgi:hypothetical protein
MQIAAEPVLEVTRAPCCPRCLQPVPPKVSRCPGCLQPIHSQRFLPLAIGVAGLLALVFALLVMYRMVSNEDAENAPTPLDQPSVEQQQDLFPDPPPANSKPSEPAKPEKRPPLDEK